RVDAKGKETVGARARRFLESDPESTRSEFKRLLGTGHRFAFGNGGESRTPEELSASVLRSLRGDLAQHLGFVPDRCVIARPRPSHSPPSPPPPHAPPP